MVNLDFKCIRITITFLSADKTSTETATVTTERISMFHLKRIMSGRKFEVRDGDSILETTFDSRKVQHFATQWGVKRETAPARIELVRERERERAPLPSNFRSSLTFPCGSNSQRETYR